jgi:hypothetical protein
VEYHLIAKARTSQNGRHALVGLFRQSVFGRLAGYEDVNDAERLRHDPAMRWIIGGKRLRVVRPRRARWAASRRNGLRRKRTFRLLLISQADGSMPSMVPSAKRRRARHGFERQPDARRTGDERLERPLCLHLLSSVVPVQPVRRSGTLLAASGNVHSADGWEGVLKPVEARRSRSFISDAASTYCDWNRMTALAFLGGAA